MPPEHLADYIAEFRALLDGHGLSYGMFGHVDAGVLHVRPALDMCDPQQELLMKQISDEVVALTARYGGLLWASMEKVSVRNTAGLFGEVLYGELRKIKAAFDPHNRLNPGKICPPQGIEAPMMKVDAVKRGTGIGKSRWRYGRPGAALWSVMVTACALISMRKARCARR